MSHTFYNSLDLTCKSPFGAVKAGQPVTFNLTVPEDLGYVDPHLVLTKDREDPVHYRMEFTGQTPKVNHFALTVTPTTSGLYFYHFDLYTDFRRIYRTPGGEGVLSWTDGQDWQLTVYEPDFKTPDWLKNGTMYQIFPDRFCEGKPNKAMPFADRIYRADKTGEPYFWPTEQSEGYLNMDYYGGDFAGIQQKLPYLRDLGVTCIYLNPIFEAHANHRYNTADYLKADPLLGTNEEFSALCAAAAKEGIRIILDGVFSHTGSDSRYFNREGRYGPGGAYRDRSSPYRSWYDFDSGYPCGYRSWWGFETLPEVQEESPSYVEFICGKGGVIDTWLNLGASGFRLDVADELPDDFIEKIRAAVKSHGEDKLLLGEVWEDATTKEAFGRAPHWLALGCARMLLRRGEREKSPLFSGAYDPNAEFSCSGGTSRARFRAAMDCRAECPAYQTMGASNRWVYESLALRSRVLSPRACRRVQVPVLVCSAGRDTQVSLREQRLLAARLPQGRLLEFPDEKHELYNAGNAGLAAFLGAVLEFFGLTAGYGKEETK